MTPYSMEEKLSNDIRKISNDVEKISMESGDTEMHSDSDNLFDLHEMNINSQGEMEIESIQTPFVSQQTPMETDATDITQKHTADITESKKNKPGKKRTKKIYIGSTRNLRNRR